MKRVVWLTANKSNRQLGGEGEGKNVSMNIPHLLLSHRRQAGTIVKELYCDAVADTVIFIHRLSSSSGTLVKG